MLIIFLLVFAVIGESAVRKTSLLTTYITNSFPDKGNINQYLPTMLEKCSKIIYIYGNKVNIIMLDYAFCGLSLQQTNYYLKELRFF